MTYPTITKEQAMQVARGIGVIVEAGLAPVFYSHHQLHVFAEAIYKLGRNAGLEEIVKWIAPQRNDVSATGEEFAEAIHYSFLKDNTPATLPEWMRDDAEDEQALMDRDMGDN